MVLNYYYLEFCIFLSFAIKSQINPILQSTTYIKQTTFKLSLDIRNLTIAEEIIKTYTHLVSRLMKYSQFWFRLTAETLVFSNHMDLWYLI